jgi:hypothetical protein
MNAHTVASRRLSLVLARTAAVTLLTPVILAAGLIAMVVVPAAILSRSLGNAMVARHRPALAPVPHLDAPHAESGAALSRAA